MNFVYAVINFIRAGLALARVTVVSRFLTRH